MQLVDKIFVLVVCVSFAAATPVLDSNTSSRIVNGHAVDITQVPYQATLQRRVTGGWTHMCGAVIITSRIVLSAAHCAESYVYATSSIRIVVGTNHRSSGGTSYSVSQIISHESYNPDTLEHDIALLVASSRIYFSNSVRAISIASSYMTLPTGYEAMVTGFGTTASDGPASSELLAAYVNIVDQTSCARAYLRIATITSGMICAAGVNPARDACQGDSGGPLVANNVLIGIVSWGEGCAEALYPGVYTRVSEYHTWIMRATSGINH